MEFSYNGKPVRFVEFAGTLYDGDGKEIEIPQCKICDSLLNPAYGKEAMAWYCWEHGFGVAKDDQTV